ncbi:MAG TPA: FprA family A-type flavoprotein [Anaerolineales bacterium]|nr:FprA family A-type flavoprotein [Anaerolineae bacterium]HIQ01162.1 FprA family A-type flavoprotein [Anaerolineales bacterium]
MPAVEIRPGIYWIGVNDRTTDLFEGLWPITQEGVSYNTYLVDGEQKGLIDLAKGLKTDEFLDQVAQVIDLSELDYIIINHMEPDHTGILRTLRRIAPQAVVLGTRKTREMLEAFYQVTEGVRVVEDGERLSLGSHTLQFFSTPFVHWPETMMTYEVTHRVLFSCDGFGGYGALQGAIFDDRCGDPALYEREALRYYVNIVAVFSRPVLKAIERLKDVPIEVIAPSHGLIWRKDPGRIIELYRKWAGYATGEREMGVTLLYGSMYGNSEQMMNAVAQGVSQAGVPVEIFDVARTHTSYVLPSLWVRQGVIVGAPTYEGGLFPPMAHTLDIAVRKRILNRKAAYFGSYGWSGGARREFARLAESLKWEVVDTFEFHGGPTLEDLRAGEAFGRRFAEALR